MFQVSSVVGLFIILTFVLATISLAYVHAPSVQNVYHGVHCLLFVLLLAFLRTKLMQVQTYVSSPLKK